MRPRPDPVPRVLAGRAAQRPRRTLPGDWLARWRAGKRPGGKGAGEPGGEPCPVGPDRPLDLSGGAAAALEFDR